MILGGFQKNSLIDFPGKIASVLFTKGCNFKCPYCHNPDLVPFKNNDLPAIDNSEIISFLEARKGFIDGVVITGGEPCLQKDLPEFLKEIKDLGYLVKLDTNGSRPKVLEHIADKNLADLIAMDIKTSFKKYNELTDEKDIEDKLKTSVRIIMDSEIDYLFRTTCSKPFVSNRIIKDICSQIKGAEKYYIQKFKRERLLAPEFYEKIDDFDQEAMEEFKSIADQFVDNCKII